MKRLTKPNGRLVGVCGRMSSWIEESNEVGELANKAMLRLAEYEDIGLTPEEIKAFLTNFGIAISIKNRELKEQHEEDKEIISKMVERIKRFEEIYCGV